MSLASIAPRAAVRRGGRPPRHRRRPHVVDAFTAGVAPAVAAAPTAPRRVPARGGGGALLARALPDSASGGGGGRGRGRGRQRKRAERESRGGRFFRLQSSFGSRARRARGDSGRRLRRALGAARGRRRRRVPGRVRDPHVRAALVAVHRRRARRGAIARGGPDGHRPRRRRVRTGRGAIRRARARRVLERFRARIEKRSTRKASPREARVARHAHAQPAQPTRVFPGRLPRHGRGGLHLRAGLGALRALAAAAAAAKSDADARLAAADLLVAWLDARVHAEGKGAWETKALAAAASELVDMDDAALAPACSALASRDVTAEPAAVVDAVLLGELTPHADDESDDVKVRLAPWDPAAERVEGGGDKKVGGEARAGGTAARAPRVRGVSVAGEDRLRRWAGHGWRTPPPMPRTCWRGPRAAPRRARRRDRAICARMRARAARLGGFGFRLRLRRRSRRADERRRVRRVRAAGGVASNSAAATAPSTAARAPLALGEGWGDRTVDPLFAVLKSPATGGKKKRLGDAHAGARERWWVPVPRVASRLLLPAGNPKRGFDARVAGGHEPGDVPPRAPPGARAGRSVRANTRDCRDCRERRAHRRLPRPATRRNEAEARKTRATGTAKGRRTSRPLSVCGVAETTKAATRLCVSAVCPRPRRRRARWMTWCAGWARCRRSSWTSCRRKPR